MPAIAPMGRSHNGTAQTRRPGITPGLLSSVADQSA